MKNLFLMGAVLLLGTALTFAQDANTSSSSSSQSGTNASSQSSTTSNQTGTTSSSSQTGTATENTTGTGVQGCLSGSTGNWMLTSSTGVTYQLSGDESQLSENANKEVEVMGTPGASASASTSSSPDTGATAGSSNNTSDNTTGSANGSAGTSGAASAHASAGSNKTLTVTSVRKVSDTCSTNNQPTYQH